MDKGDKINPVGLFWSLVAISWIVMALGFLFWLGSYWAESDGMDIRQTYFTGVGLMGCALVLSMCAWFFGRAHRPSKAAMGSGEISVAVVSAMVAFLPFAVAAYFAYLTMTTVSVLLMIPLILIPCGLVCLRFRSLSADGAASVRSYHAATVVAGLAAVAAIATSAAASASVSDQDEYSFKPWRAPAVPSGPPPLATATPEQIAKADHWLLKLYVVTRARQQEGLDKGAADARKLDAELVSRSPDLGVPKGVRINSNVRPAGDAMATLIRYRDEKFAIATFPLREGRGTYYACTGERICGPGVETGGVVVGRISESTSPKRPVDAYGRSEPMGARWFYRDLYVRYLPGTFADLIAAADPG